MKIECVYYQETPRGKPERIPEKGDALPAAYGALPFPWLPGFTDQLAKARFHHLRHPENKEWYAVIRIDYPFEESPPTGTLLMRPGVVGRSVPVIRLSANRRLTLDIVCHYIEQFLEGLRS